MPLWDFKCNQCDRIVELRFSSYHASLQAVCPSCGKTVERLPACSGFVVTGYNAKNLYSKKS